MQGFPWVRIDRTVDRTAGLKKVGRQAGRDEVWALGLYVRLKLTIAARFPEGVARMTTEDLALELDVTDDAVAALLANGYLVQVEEGLAFAGWSDDPAVRDLLARRTRATGRLPAADRQATGTRQAGDRQASGRLPAQQNMTEQNMTEQDRSMRNTSTAAAQEQPLSIVHGEAVGIVLAAWPPEKRCAPRAVLAAIRQDNANPDSRTCMRIAESGRTWVAAYQEGGRLQYLPKLDTWISSGAWREAPPAETVAPARRPRTRSGEPSVTLAELDAIIDATRAAGH